MSVLELIIKEKTNKQTKTKTKILIFFFEHFLNRN